MKPPAEQPAAPKPPRQAIHLTITLLIDGNNRDISVHGPVKDHLLCYGMLVGAFVALEKMDEPQIVTKLQVDRQLACWKCNKPVKDGIGDLCMTCNVIVCDDKTHHRSHGRPIERRGPGLP